MYVEFRNVEKKSGCTFYKIKISNIRVASSALKYLYCYTQGNRHNG
jgi:hypothetical protein